MDSCPRVPHVLSTVSPGFSLVLHPRGRMVGLGGNVGSACKEFEDDESGILG